MAKGKMQLHQVATQFSYHLTHMQILITLRLVRVYGFCRDKTMTWTSLW